MSIKFYVTDILRRDSLIQLLESLGWINVENEESNSENITNDIESFLTESQEYCNIRNLSEALQNKINLINSADLVIWDTELSEEGDYTLGDLWITTILNKKIMIWTREYDDSMLRRFIMHNNLGLIYYGANSTRIFGDILNFVTELVNWSKNIVVKTE